MSHSIAQRDNRLQTSGRQSRDQSQRSVVGSQWFRIGKDVMRFALCSLPFFIRVNLRESAVNFILKIILSVSAVSCPNPYLR